jgi:hypothetical protein
MVEKWGHFEGVLTNGDSHHSYGYIGACDRRMMPILRPGRIVLADTSKNRTADGDWTTEHDRPLYFVDVRVGYRCGWLHQDGSRLVMQPHPLSHGLPEWWRTPEEAEIVGQVAGVVTRLHGRSRTARGEFPEEPGD